MAPDLRQGSDSAARARLGGEAAPLRVPTAPATLALRVRAHRVFPFVRLREKAAGTFWLIPALFFGGAILAAVLTQRIDTHLTTASVSSPVVWNADNAVGALSMMATAMLSFIAVVFSIGMVSMQLASQQFSPRVLRTYVRSATTKLALGVFIAAFVYPLLSYGLIEHNPSGQTQPATISASVSTTMTLTAIAVFVIYVSHTINLMRITMAIRSVAEETRRAFRHVLLPASAYVKVEPPAQDAPLGIVTFRKQPWSFAATRAAHGVIQGVDVVQLVHCAQRHDCVVRALVGVGDYVSDGQPIAEILAPAATPGRGPLPLPTEAEILRAMDVGPERTLYQDPYYGLRELADVAAQALSPAVNAPTTAVQVIDRLEDILRQIAGLPDPTGLITDEDGEVRLVMRPYTWDETLALALTEIRRYGAGSPQVTRRLAGLFDSVAAVATAGHLPAIERQRRELVTAVGAAVPGQADREFALAPDRLGLG